MFIYMLLAALFAKIKGYRIKPILRDCSLYPLVVAEIIYIILQVNIFLGNYSYIQYASIFKTLYLYTLIIPILVHKLYKPGIYGSVLTIVGSMLNKFVMSQNGGKMPVFASLSKITGYFDEIAINTVDKIHVIGNEATKYKFLTDFIDVGYSVLSIGDVLIHSFIFIIVYNVIKEVNKDIKYTMDNRKEGSEWRIFD